MDYCAAVTELRDDAVFWTEDPSQVPAMEKWIGGFEAAIAVAPTAADREDLVIIQDWVKAMLAGDETRLIVVASTDAQDRLEARLDTDCHHLRLG